MRITRESHENHMRINQSWQTNRYRLNPACYFVIVHTTDDESSHDRGIRFSLYVHVPTPKCMKDVPDSKYNKITHVTIIETVL